MTTKEYFKALKNNQDECLEIMKAKNADYAGDQDPYRNFKVVENIGICSVEVGLLARMTDKLSRVNNLINKEAQVKDESIDDTLTDLMNYTNILKVYRNSKRNKGN